MDLNPDGRPLSERAETVFEAAEQLAAEVKGAASELARRADLGGRTRNHPYAMLAAAAGVGYLLGGGLFTRWTARIVRFGMRISAVPLLRDELIAFVGLDGKSRGEAPPSQRRERPRPGKRPGGPFEDRSTT